ncbi:hypothetical protein GHT07_04300 [Caenimonas koreensis DSM 17982]|uniref:Uncharacterized protein n=1 Tax=Caenimonas koreensis DSM 17982 TaxID=1121255 RepID=A0A844AR27_9BURK|nr:hypothetical protein [Caenimonas koreensis]MRD46484.1 hypothetical protein [Caenimonas koreensis DSM 17982]
MALFVIIPTVSDTSALDKAMTRYEKKAYQLPRGEWLVAYEGTSRQLSDELQVTDNQLGVPCVILGFGSYFGRAGKDIWEWISVNSA